MARIERLRSFLIAHPPLVVFTFCIGMTAVAFVSFAYYIKFNNVKNHDVQRVRQVLLLIMLAIFYQLKFLYL